MYKYKLKEGAEGRIFMNTAKGDEPNTIVSQVRLESPYLEEMASTGPAPNHVTGVAPQSEQPLQAVAPQPAPNTNEETQ